MEDWANQSEPECVNAVQYMSDVHRDETTKLRVQVPFLLLYLALFVAGVCGNGLVIASVWRHRSLQTVRNFFIVSLSCSDLVVCLTSLPVTPLTVFMKNWRFGAFLCYLIPLVQGMSVCISTFTLTAVALDRYILIVFPTRRPIRRAQAVPMIAAIWALAAGVSLPMVIHYRHFRGDERAGGPEANVSVVTDAVMDAVTDADANVNASVNASDPLFCGYFCDEVWPSQNERHIYGAVVLMLQFLVPLLCITFCYSQICVRLSGGLAMKRLKDAKKLSNAAGRPRMRLLSATRVTDDKSPRKSTDLELEADSRRQAALRRRRRTNRMLIAMVGIFAVCWFPQVIMNVLRDFGALPAFVVAQQYLYGLLCHAWAMTSTVWNPLLYGVMNDTFRRAFVELLPCFRRHRLALAPGNRPSVMANERDSFNEPAAQHPQSLPSALTVSVRLQRCSSESPPAESRLLLHSPDGQSATKLYANGYTDSPRRTSLRSKRLDFV